MEMTAATPEGEWNKCKDLAYVKKMPEASNKYALSQVEQNSRRKLIYLKCMLTPLFLKAKESPLGFYFQPSHLGTSVQPQVCSSLLES